MQLNLRRLSLVIGILAFVVIGGGYYAYHYYTTGAVTIQTNQLAQIDIIQVSSNKTVISKKSTQNLHGSLRSGDYIIQASNQTGASRTAVTVKTRTSQTAQLTIAPVQAATQAVAFNGSNFIINPGDSSLTGLDSSAQQLFTINDSQTRPQLLLPNITQVNAVRWVSPSQAVVIGDGIGYWFDNTGLHQLNLAFKGNIMVAANPAAKQFAIGIDRKVYLFSAGSLNPSVSFTLNTTTYQLALSNQAITAYLPPDAISGSGSNQVAGYNLNLTTKQVSAFSQPIFGVSVAPGGNKLAYGSSQLVAISDENLSTNLQKVPTKSSILAWQSDNHLLFADNKAVWDYSLTTHSAQKVATTPDNSTIVAFYQLPVVGRVYFSVVVNGSNAIYGYVNGQSGGPNPSDALKNYLPAATGHYSIDYSDLNLVRPVLRITTLGILNTPSQYNDYVQQSLSYRDEAIAALKNHNINPTQYTVVYIPASF